MSKICVTTNTSILIFTSTCKQLTQSEPTGFSKNGVFHSKGVVIAFSNCLKVNANPTLQLDVIELNRNKFWNTATLRQFTPLLQKIYRNRIPENFLLTEILDI